MLKKFLFTGIVNWWTALKRYEAYSTNGSRLRTTFPDRIFPDHFSGSFLCINTAHSTASKRLIPAHKDNCYIQA